MIRVFLSGEHAHRTPLSYPALSPLWDGEISLVDRPEDADLYLFAHSLDVGAAPHSLVLDWRARRVPVAILSEEPFWDTIWGKRPLDRLIYVETALGPLPVHQLTHQTSDIFRFNRIPYYLLTEPGFIDIYRTRFARNAARSRANWRNAFAHRAVRRSFMFERRPEPFHHAAWPQSGVIGLCAWRTELAEALASPRTECLGRSWQGGPRRQALADWHGDKMERMDDRAVLMGAYENTHQRDYLTEKPFDAFACGAIPLYYAAPDHRIHDLGLPDGSWVNSYGQSPAEAAATLRDHDVTPEVIDAFAEAQRILAEYFADQERIIAERRRLRAAVSAALKGLLDAGP